MVYKRLRDRGSGGMPTVIPAEVRTYESAVQAVAGVLCQRYAGRFQRSTIIKVVVATAAVPANLPKRTVDRLEFLMGAALWMLDYLEDACDDPDQYLDLLSERPSGELEYYMPCAEDLIHDQSSQIAYSRFRRISPAVPNRIGSRCLFGGFYLNTSSGISAYLWLQWSQQSGVCRA